MSNKYCEDDSERAQREQQQRWTHRRSCRGGDPQRFTECHMAQLETRETNQHSSNAHLHHSNHKPQLRTHWKVIARPSRLTQPSANHRRAEPYYNTDTNSCCVFRLLDQAYHPWPVHWVEQRASLTILSFLNSGDLSGHASIDLSSDLHNPTLSKDTRG